MMRTVCRCRFSVERDENVKFENDPIEWKNEGITPSQELQDEGFKAGYKPPAGVFNWFWNRMVRITRELQEKLSGHEVTNSAEHDLMEKEIASKLDESEFTSENILEKIGGTETGMDASTLEGHPASYFATAVHGHAVASKIADGFMGKADKIKLDGMAGVEVINNLECTSTTAALSAAQGKVLKGLVDGIQTTTDYTATLTTSWGTTAPFSQTVVVTGIKADTKPIIGVDLSDTVATALAQQEAWNMVSKAVTGANSVTFKCYEEKPTVAIPIQIKVVC